MQKRPRINNSDGIDSQNWQDLRNECKDVVDTFTSGGPPHPVIVTVRDKGSSFVHIIPLLHGGEVLLIFTCYKKLWIPVIMSVRHVFGRASCRVS